MSQAELQLLVDQLAALDEDGVVTVITSVMQARPETAPTIVHFAVPDLTYPPQRALSERRANGVVKSYNEQKGFGFIQCEELSAVFGKDVFVHSAQIPGEGFVAGAAVNFAVVLNKDNKPQAYDIQFGNTSGGKGKGKSAADAWGKGATDAWGAGADAWGGSGAGGAWAGGGESWDAWGSSKGKGGGKDDWSSMLAAAWSMMKGKKGGGDSWGGAKGGDSWGGAKGGDSWGCAKGGDAWGIGKGGDAWGGKGCGKTGKSPEKAAARNAANAEAIEKAEVIGEFQGQVKSFNEKNGYGFIECAEIKEQYGNDVFLHHAQLGSHAIGEQVIFELFVNGQGKPQAKSLRSIDGSAAKRQRTDEWL